MNPSQNRYRLNNVLPKSIVVVSAYDAMQLTADQAASFVQESHFLWLTGIHEAGWKAIIDNGHLTLVRPGKSEIEKIFDGESSNDQIEQASGARDIIDHQDFEPFLRQIARNHSVVHSVYDRTEYGFVHNPAHKELDALLNRIFSSVQSCDNQLKQLRAIKQPEEIKAMQVAIDITSKAFMEVRDHLVNVKYEYEIDALFTYLFRKQNAQHGYEPIVAAGLNACTLHYVSNGEKLRKGNLVLLDVGARMGGYSADITRTYGLGRVTKRQAAVHLAVQHVQEQVISIVRPGLLFKDYIDLVGESMKEALLGLGLMSSIDDQKRYHEYFPHAISHGLGMDVHDSLGGFDSLQPGMVLTVEPGIYIPKEGIGVRIEDDILVTATGHKNLSGDLSTSL